MVETKQPRARYRVERMVCDMAVRGWNNTDLARAADVSGMTVARFLRGKSQTAKTADRLARALGYSIRRYLVTDGEAIAS